MCSTILILWCNLVKFALWRVKPFLSYCVRKDRALNCFEQTAKVFCGSGWCNLSSNSLRTGRYGDQIPMGGEILRTRPDVPCVPSSLLFSWYWVIPGAKAAGAWRWPPTPSSAEVKEFFFYFINQESEYKVFYKLMGWLCVKLVYVLAWLGPLQRGDLVHLITGQLATVFSVFIRRYLVEWGGVVGSSELLVLYGAWHFWHGWLLAQLEYLGLRGS